MELTELGQQFEEQIGAAERVNLHLLQNFFKNRTLNESQLPTALDEDTPVEVIPVLCDSTLFPYNNTPEADTLTFVVGGETIMKA